MNLLAARVVIIRIDELNAGDGREPLAFYALESGVAGDL